MAVFRVERNTGYTVMSNHHLRNKELSLKAKGLLSQMLSLPEDWDYTLAGLSYINRESIDAIRTAVWELEKAGYITRRQGRDEKGKMTAIEYTIYEQPQPPELDCPVLENPTADNPTTENPTSENPMQLNKDISRTNLQKKEKSNTDLSSTHSIPIHSLNPLPYGEDEAAQPPERKGTERNDAYRVYEEIIKDNIEYNILLQDMKFDHIRFHDLRHTAATNMHQLTGDFYTVGEVLGHTLAGIGVSLGLSMNFEAVTARYVDVRLERKKEVLDAYHGAVKQADPAKAKEAEPKKAKSAAKKKSSEIEL